MRLSFMDTVASSSISSFKTTCPPSIFSKRDSACCIEKQVDDLSIANEEETSLSTQASMDESIGGIRKLTKMQSKLWAAYDMLKSNYEYKPSTGNFSAKRSPDSPCSSHTPEISSLETFFRELSFKIQHKLRAAYDMLRGNYEYKPSTGNFSAKQLPNTPCSSHTPEISSLETACIEPSAKLEILNILFSQEAINAYKACPIFRDLIRCIGSKKIKAGDGIQAIKFILSIHRKNPIITWQDIVNIWQIKIDIDSIIESILGRNTDSHGLSSSAKELFLESFLSEPLHTEYSKYIIENLGRLLTQEEPIDFNELLKIAPEKIKYGLVWACIGSDIPTVESMLKSNMFLHQKSEQKHRPYLVTSPLEWAVCYGEIYWLKKFFEIGSPNIDALNQGKKTLLDLAVQHERPKIAAFLIEKGIKKNHKDTTCSEPFRLALEKNQCDILESSFNKSDFDPLRNHTDKAKLHYAKKHGQNHIINVMQNTIENRFPRALHWLGKLYSRFITWLA